MIRLSNRPLTATPHVGVAVETLRAIPPTAARRPTRDIASRRQSSATSRPSAAEAVCSNSSTWARTSRSGPGRTAQRRSSSRSPAIGFSARNCRCRGFMGTRASRSSAAVAAACRWSSPLERPSASVRSASSVRYSFHAWAWGAAAGQGVDGVQAGREPGGCRRESRRPPSPAGRPPPGVGCQIASRRSRA